MGCGWQQFKKKSVGKIRLKKQKRQIDKKLFFYAFTLTTLGLIAVADTSAPVALTVFSDKFYFLKQQIVWGAIGLGALLFVSKVHYSFWQKIALPLFIVNILILILVLIPGIGAKALGARRWIFLGPISFQPSEFAKLALVVYLAKVGARNKTLLAYFLPLLLVGGLIMFQPDLGTTLVILAAGLVQIFISGINLLYFLGAVLVTGLASSLLIYLSEYRRGRFLSFLTQLKNPLGASYHARQILLALGSGGLFGIGLGQSRQKYLFLPEAATDSIFAVIAEEVGFIGALVLIILFVAFIFRALKIAQNAPDRFSKILATGIVAWIGGQAFLNMASMAALVPLTGIPLPFISYGGSALTMVLLATGILLNISRYEIKKK
ncbi:putative lipid II flippase FtsW [Candidatus Woesebacteria bacterium]|nr:MAG: putative lipid II flippase FtsW [Candidatus Woesebacteria bacterium]